MIKTTEFEDQNTVNLHCTICGKIKNINTEDAKFAYLEINKFRGEHAHLKKEGE